MMNVTRATFLKACEDAALDLKQQLDDELDSNELENLSECYLEVEESVLDECYFRAEKTVELFDLESPNHYKDAGNICYWLRKLKPYYLGSDDKETADRLIQLPVNEMLAFEVAINIIEASQAELIKKEEDRMKYDVEIIEKSIRINLDNKEKIGFLYDSIVKSLRYHVHSPTQLPMFLEVMLALPLEMLENSHE